MNECMFSSSGLINNIAAKYDLEPGQITVSAVESDSTTSFQIMPYNAENLEDFQQKMDQIDGDVSRSILPLGQHRASVFFLVEFK